ncbi:hypothetical protein M1893_29030, partial [Klebsiella pneumoniae]|nr:hypothetical protein [Klebsiella pneumoniae]
DIGTTMYKFLPSGVFTIEPYSSGSLSGLNFSIKDNINGNPPQFINRQGHPDETNYHERYAATERSGCAIASAPRAP